MGGARAAYSTEGAIHVKVGKLPPYTQKVSPGFVVVGFSGTRLFCMRVGGGGGAGGGGASTITIDVPPFAALYQMLDLKQFADSYKCACLGMLCSSSAH